MNEEDKLFQTSERVFQTLDDDWVMTEINIFVPKHINCLRKGARLTIDHKGLWCDMDDPEPKEG